MEIRKYESREEGVALRPYDGLDALEVFLKGNCRLSVKSNEGTDHLEPDAKLVLGSRDLVQLGLTIGFGNIDELNRLVRALVMDIEDVDVMIVARDLPSSTLRESHVLNHFPFREITSEYIVSAAGTDNHSRILRNSATGFQLEVAFVLNKNNPGDNSIRPRTLGALIAISKFILKPYESSDTLQPEPLRKDVRDRLNLPDSTLWYVEATPMLLTAANFRDAVRFYVHENLLSEAQFLAGDAGYLGQALVLDHFVTSLVYEVSRALNLQEVPDEQEILDSQVMVWLSKRAGLELSDALLEKAKTQPEYLLALLNAKQAMTKKILKGFKALNEES